MRHEMDQKLGFQCITKMTVGEKFIKLVRVLVIVYDDGVASTTFTPKEATHASVSLGIARSCLLFKLKLLCWSLLHPLPCILTGPTNTYYGYKPCTYSSC
jgi:hypothetical protein